MISGWVMGVSACNLAGTVDRRQRKSTRRIKKNSLVAQLCYDCCEKSRKREDLSHATRIHRARHHGRESCGQSAEGRPCADRSRRQAHCCGGACQGGCGFGKLAACSRGGG